MVESSLVYYRVDNALHPPILIDCQIGTAASVDFDFERIWYFVKAMTHFFVSDLQFIHVHPTGAGIGVAMSATDVNCLHGLTLAFGASPVFRIIQFDDDDMLSLAGKHASYLWRDKGAVQVREEPNSIKEALQDRQNEKTLLMMLKLLAYSEKQEKQNAGDKA